MLAIRSHGHGYEGHGGGRSPFGALIAYKSGPHAQRPADPNRTQHRSAISIRQIMGTTKYVRRVRRVRARASARGRGGHGVGV